MFSNNSIDITTIILFSALALISLIIIITMLRKMKRDKCVEKIDNLERKKNSVTNIPIAHELSKIAIIARNEELNKNYTNWQERWKEIATKDLSRISEDIILLDEYVENYKIRLFNDSYREIDDNIEHVLLKAQTLLDEIKSVTLNEEQHRLVITDLKSKFREIKHLFSTNVDNLGNLVEVIRMKFELISERMHDFDSAMENNDYIEVEKIADNINEQIKLLEFGIKKLPNLILLLENVIPKRLSEIEELYAKYKEEQLPLEHLNVESNLKDAHKTINNIYDRIKLLDLEDAEYEVKAIVEYSDIIVKEFEKEKIARQHYYELLPRLNDRIESLKNLIEIAQSETVSISGSYNLEQVEEVNINDLLTDLDRIIAQYSVILNQQEEGQTGYSELKKELETLLDVVNQSELMLNNYMTTIDGMREDENRAREQIQEMRLLMREIKYRVRMGRLPIIPNVFIIQLEDANEAIKTILDELEKNPINVEVLNTRVDTARDLSFKLFNTTNELIKTSYMAERAILYGNRYRSTADIINRGLKEAEREFFNGTYSDALSTAISVLERVEPGIYKRLMELYDSAKPKVMS